ncbi:MAG: glycoside hydrolase [Acidaminococcaceae bacterium]|nr:glycoside hydrolase [Acidaminococcaceae bacterium]
MMVEKNEFTIRKERKKKVRVFVQIIILIIILIVAVNALYTFKKYQPFNENNTTFAGDQGFIALSYLGVDRVGSGSLIGAEQLDEQLNGLKKQGYVTITQQDILDYYQKGKLLPKRSVFLAFEDGRRDTAVFTQKILERLNYKATIFSYPEKFDNNDTKFLLPSELKDLEATTYWELGTNGYRLYFINVYDRYHNYLGNMNPLEHSMMMSVLGRNYNHYLMDYIRDENGFPKESYTAMKNRISYDYKALEEVYTKEVGYVPQAYVLMHSNTGAFGNNDKVSAVNEYWIKKLFKMNFNREGYCKNVKSSSLYDLTRMQPQAYWSVNHLLMRIKYDTNDEGIQFINGDMRRHADWDVEKGAAEFKDEAIILTSLPLGSGIMRLKNSEDFKDVIVNLVLRGNKYGQQKIYLRGTDGLKNYVLVNFTNNNLIITESNALVKKELLKLNLDKFAGRKDISIEQDKNAVVQKELETFARYAQTKEVAQIQAERLKDKYIENPKTIEEGAPKYEPQLSYHSRSVFKVKINLKGKKLTVNIDGKDAAKDIILTNDKAGNIYLGADWGGYGWSQKNLADDVFDGVFDKLLITENTGADNEKVLYDEHFTGVQGVYASIKRAWMHLIDWFIRNM